MHTGLQGSLPRRIAERLQQRDGIAGIRAVEHQLDGSQKRTGSVPSRFRAPEQFCADDGLLTLPLFRAAAQWLSAAGSRLAVSGVEALVRKGIFDLQVR